jgi:glycerate kinase
LLKGCPIVANVGISQTVLIACARFGPRLSADAVAVAIADGIEDGGGLTADVCPLATLERGEEDVRRLLDALAFDVRMRAARAVVIGARRLEERMLAGSLTFEIATRARQGGVPAYAITAENELEPFDARILDFQLVLQAGSGGALAAAGCMLASVV